MLKRTYLFINNGNIFFLYQTAIFIVVTCRCLMKNNDFKELAPVFTKHLIDRRVDINSTVRLSCQVNGLPVPLGLWYKDGQPVDFESTYIYL